MSERVESWLRERLKIKSNTVPKLYKLRKTYSFLRNKFASPVWVKHPTNIQLETHNLCNLWQGSGKGCIHCNVKPSGKWNMKRGYMKDEIIEYVCDYWGKHGALDVAPYINGEFMLDKRAKWISDICEKNKLSVVIDTNGSLYKFRERIVHKNNTQIRFSYSANTRETYELIHGKNLFYDATKTIEWFLENKYPSQYPMLYYILNRYNLNEVYDYIKKWQGLAHIVIFPIHEVKNIQLESEKTKLENKDSWREITKKITGKYPKQPCRPIDIYPDGKRRIRHFRFWESCQGTNSFSVNWQGLILHCTDIPYSFNYGSVYDNDMLEIWHKRNKLKLNHVACSVCSVRSPKHDKILIKYLGPKSQIIDKFMDQAEIY